jgi:hypothetical protein
MIIIIMMIDLSELLLPSLLGFLSADNRGEKAEVVLGVVRFLDPAQLLETPLFSGLNQHENFCRFRGLRVPVKRLQALIHSRVIDIRPRPEFAPGSLLQLDTPFLSKFVQRLVAINPEQDRRPKAFSQLIFEPIGDGRERPTAENLAFCADMQCSPPARPASPARNTLPASCTTQPAPALSLPSH